MAFLIPTTPFPGTPPDLVRLQQVLKRLPDNYVVFQRLSTLHGPGPEFWILRQDRRSVLILVSGATPQMAQSAPQLGLFTSETVTQRPGQAEQTSLAAFLQEWPEKVGVPIPAVLLLPHLMHKQWQSVWPDGFSLPVASKELLNPDALGPWLDEHLSESLKREQIDHLRRLFSPEVVVPAPFTVRQPPERHTAADLTDYLLDYNQEQALKLDLALPDEGQAAARELSLRLVNGVAGSGKSLLVIYRARLFRQMFPNKKILVLTHNRALIKDLRRRYWKMSKGDSEVEWLTFMGWCRKLYPADRKWRDPIRFRERQELVAHAWRKHLVNTSVTETMLLEEIDWYKDRLLFGLEDYLAADRTGRGFALAEGMRERAFQAMTTYHQMLQERQTMDWGDLPRQIWRFVQVGEMVLPQYDVILIDEAQFFAPIWFELIKLALKPGLGHLFLVADPGQGFLKRRQSWLSSGLEVRGRVVKLDKCYRTTREILDFATFLYRSRLPEEDEDVVVPNLLEMPHGVVPQIITLTSEQDETTRVVNEIKALQKAGVSLGHIMVIHASYEDVDGLMQRFILEFGEKQVVDPRDKIVGKQLRVCPLNGATGLESPIVFLLGVHELYERENSIRLSDEERAELVRENTRKLYMAITRAGQRLVLTYVGELPPLFQRLLGGNGSELPVAL
jgi:hypothetical protein